MPEQFYSEDLIDHWCANNLPIPQRGLAVDLGCAHPEKYSNSAWLRNRGWDVYAIDGDPAYAPEWKDVPNAYFFNGVVSNNVEVSFLTEPTNALVSRVHPSGEKVRSINIAQWLRKEIQIPSMGMDPRRIDFMSIDIENSEPIALQQMFEVMWYPDILVVEYRSCHAGINVRTLEMPLLTGRYRLRCMTDSNAVFSK